jgi:excisionase family DNA binding protein
MSDILTRLPRKHRARLVKDHGLEGARRIVSFLDERGILPSNDIQWKILRGAKNKLLPEDWNLQPPWDKVDAYALLSQGLLTVPEAADFLKVGKTKLYDWMNAGVLPYIMFGTETSRKQRRIPKAVVILFAEKGFGV